jgi:hypothetical protein
MANILGKLLVSIGVDITSLVTGMDTASKEAKKTAEDISKAFDHDGDSVGNALGAFGPLGATLKEAGSSIGEVFDALGGGGSGLSVAIGAIAGIGVAAAGAAAGLTALALEGSEVIENLAHISEKTGISTHDLQTFQAAGKTVGVSLDDMVGAFRKFDQALTGNGKNAGAAQATLRSLGITATDNREALLQAADAFKNMEDGPLKAADAVALFGKAGLNMIPFLDKGRDGVLEFEDAVNTFGPKITSQGVAATEAWKTSVEKLSLAWDAFTVNIGEKVLPIMSSVVTEMAGLTRGAGVLGGALSSAIGAALSGHSVIGAVSASLAGSAADTAGPSDADRLAAKNKSDAIAAFQEHYNTLLQQAQGMTEQDVALQEKLKEIQDDKLQGKIKEAYQAQLEIPALQAAVDAENQRLATLLRIQSTMEAIAKGGPGGSHPFAAPDKRVGGTPNMFGGKDFSAPLEAPVINGAIPGGITSAISSLVPSANTFGTANKEAQDFLTQYAKETASTVDDVNADYDQQLQHWKDLLNQQAITQDQWNQISIALEKERQAGLVTARKQDGTSTLTDSFTDMYAKLSASGRDFSRSLSQDVGGAIDSLNQQLAALATGGKVNFSKLGQSLAQNVVSSGLKKTESLGIDALGLGSLSGGGGKPDGTQPNPIYVAISDSSTLSALTGGDGLADIVGTPGATNPGGTVADLIAGGAFGGGAIPTGAAVDSNDDANTVADFLSNFGGFMADGGNVTPGKAYVVGENHPEFFVPGKSGQVTPAAVGTGGGDTHIFSPTYQINTPNADTFRKSQSQIISEGYATANLARQRNGS